LIKLELANSSNGLLDLASDMIKCIGLLAKVNFDRNIGVDSIYIKGYLPFTRNLVRMGLKQNAQQNNNLLSNLLKTIGIFGH